VMYAATYQRRRHVWTLINGGPGSGLYKTTDGGTTWTELENGLPQGDIGRIGLAMSADPDIVYAIVEAAEGSGFYASTDRGANWEKRSSYLSASPQYYQELVADPVDPDRVYSMDTWMHVTEDGGRSFEMVGEDHKHVDNHAMWIDPDNTDYLLAGCDGGVYESFDRGGTWHFKANLPITQFYKIAVDNDEPFYNVYGGTQDNNTIGGPTRTVSASGITNHDWFITLGGDGFEPQIDPTDPDIVYSQYQYGGLARFDRRTGETIDIQPQPTEETGPLKWNWSSALLISPHNPSRLYYGANVLFRSDDRGDTWEPISGDLTRQLDRNRLEVMGRVWSVDAVSKNRSTSMYGNLVAISESPVQADLLYLGTDDGLVQVTENGGGDWRRQEKFANVPDMSYVSSLTASRHDADVVYATFDNHKRGDFLPYVVRSSDKGRSWKSISGDLPEFGHAHDIVEDPVDPDLLFVGTEFGVFFTKDGGDSWIQLESGIPVIACRDLEIQERENDLVVGTFGRGFYVLDDYTPLRHATEAMLAQEAALFPIKPALMFAESLPFSLPGKAFMGDSFYTAPNPEVGAVFTYHLKDRLTTRKERRQEVEKERRENDQPNYYPSWEELKAEDREEDPAIVFTVRDMNGGVVRRITGPHGSGTHRVTWDLRFPPTDPTELEEPAWRSPWNPAPVGPLVAPGTYTVSMSKRVDGQWTELAGPESFEVVPLGIRELTPAQREEAATFAQHVADLHRSVTGATAAGHEAQDRIRHLKRAAFDTPSSTVELMEELRAVELRLADVMEMFNGDPTLSRRSEPQMPSINRRLGRIIWGHWTTWTGVPTNTYRTNFDLAADQFTVALAGLRQILEEDLPAIESQLEGVGGPWTPGRLPNWVKP